MSSPAPMARRMVCRQSSGSRPPVGAMPMSNAVGMPAAKQGLAERGHDGDVIAGLAQHVTDVAGRRE